MDCEDDGPGLIDLGDNTGWEDLDHSHAGREFEAFHDLSDEMYTLTGK